MVLKQARSELLVVWKQPRSRQRYLIGRLSREAGTYCFRYITDHSRSLHEAREAGFQLLDAFPELDGEWRSETLFPAFLRRLPRARHHEVLRKLRIDVEDPLEVLRVTGGRLPTDTLEFLEPIERRAEAAEGPTYTVRFPIAGWRYYSGEEAMAELSPGQRLRLELDRQNRFDPNAIRVFSPSGVLLGYVPAIYSTFLDAAVEKGQYKALVAEVGPREDPQRRVVVHFKGAESPLDRVRLVPEDIDKYAAAVF